MTVWAQELFCGVAEELPRSVVVSVAEVVVEVAVLLVVEEVLVGRCLCVVDGPESWSVVSGRLRTLWELVGDQIVVTRSRSLVLVLRMCVWSKECIVNASMAVRSGWCSVVEVGVAVRGDAIG